MQGSAYPNLLQNLNETPANHAHNNSQSPMLLLPRFDPENPEFNTVNSQQPFPEERPIPPAQEGKIMQLRISHVKIEDTFYRFVKFKEWKPRRSPEVSS